MKCTIVKLTALLFVLVSILPCCGVKKETSRAEASPSPQTEMNLETSPSPQTAEQILFPGVTDYKIDDPQSYYNEEHNFSMEYPAAWDFSTYGHASEHPDGSPDSGIRIFIEGNKDNWIDVYGLVSRIQMPPLGVGDPFTTAEGVSGYIQEYPSSDEIRMIYLVLGEDRWVGAVLHVDEKVFDENKGQILGILKSIKIDVRLTDMGD